MHLFRDGQSQNKQPCLFCTFPRCATILATPHRHHPLSFDLGPLLLSLLSPSYTLGFHSLWSMTPESMSAPYFSLPTFNSPPPITTEMSPFQHHGHRKSNILEQKHITFPWKPSSFSGDFIFPPPFYENRTLKLPIPTKSDLRRRLWSLVSKYSPSSQQQHQTDGLKNMVHENRIQVLTILPLG